MNLIARMAFCAGLACSLPVLAQSAGRHATSTLERPIMTQLPHRLQPLFNRTKTVCFARFVIEVPASATVVYGRMTVDTEVRRYAGKATEAEGKIEEFMKENRRRVSATAREDDAPDEWGGKRWLGKMPGLTHLLSKFSDSQYFLHSFLVLGDDIFLMEVLGFFENDVQRFISDHEEVARQLRARKNEEVPTEEGICIDGAIANLRPLFENIQIGIRLAEFPDVHFSIESKKNSEYVKPDQDFLDRFTSTEKNARAEGKGKWYDRIKFFSREPRTVLEWRGHQVLARVPAIPGSHDRHEFTFYSGGEANDPFHPEIDIELETGVKDNSKAGRPPSLTDAEALALWEKLLGSIRVRQVTPPAAVKPAAMLGMVVAAGQPCPQTGWWECRDGDHYDGVAEIRSGKVRYFHQHAALPQATLLAQNGWWRLFDGGATFRRQQPSQWQLTDRRWIARVPQSSAAYVNNVGAATDQDTADAALSEVTLAPGAKCACGKPCPASGWWDCADADAVEPARWFALGETMPDIRYRANLNWREKLAGQPPVVARRAAWRFLRAEQRSVPPAFAEENPPGVE
jgi:hypothetical protein